MVEVRRSIARSPTIEEAKFQILIYDVPERLYLELAKTRNVFGIFFCSPWISEVGIHNFFKLLQKKSKGKIFEILTRPPFKEEVWHREMIKALSDKCNARIYCNRTLHAKLYLVVAETGSFAIFGSPNLTKAARSNLEVALITYSSSFIDKLFNVFQIHLKGSCRYWR